jgi:hypothetical protein
MTPISGSKIGKAGDEPQIVDAVAAAVYATQRVELHDAIAALNGDRRTAHRLDHQRASRDCYESHTTNRQSECHTPSTALYRLDG